MLNEVRIVVVKDAHLTTMVTYETSKGIYGFVTSGNDKGVVARDKTAQLVQKPESFSPLIPIESAFDYERA